MTFQKSSSHPRDQTPIQLREMKEDIQQTTGRGIRPICTTLQLPRSSFYYAAAPTFTQRSDHELDNVIATIFKRHRQRYGYRRIWDELADREITCAPDRVRRIMQERGLKAIQPRNYVPKTSDARADRPSPNILLDQARPEKPDQVWAGDITFFPTARDWLSLAVIIDLYSGKIVGWALAYHMRTELVTDTLRQALGIRSAAQSPIFHRDRGSQYGSAAHRQLLSQAGMRQSMSARANPYHNA